MNTGAQIFLGLIIFGVICAVVFLVISILPSGSTNTYPVPVSAPMYPTPPVAPEAPPAVDYCATYIASDMNMSDSCLSQIWGKSGCLTPLPTDTAWWKSKPRSTVENDMMAWATMSDSSHRQVCYGPDLSKWPK